MHLITPRLILRPFSPGDAEACFAFLSDRETCYLDGGYEPFSAMDAEYGQLMDRFASQPDRMMIELACTGEVIGTINLFPDEAGRPDTIELGYVLAPLYRRQGYATEAVQAVIAHLLSNGTQCVTLGIAEVNLPSQHMAEKLGFVRTGEVESGILYPPVGIVPLIQYDYRS